MKPASRRALLGGMLLLLGSLVSVAARPGKRLSELTPDFRLETVVPERFGHWASIPPVADYVNSKSTQLLEEVYSQILSRTYRDERTGERVMLSIAYGGDQSEANQLHIPDVCYPSQGFRVTGGERIQLATPLGVIPAKRLMTEMPGRPEPLTYWTTVGSHVEIGMLDRKLTQLEYGLHGEIPDGLEIGRASCRERV